MPLWSARAVVAARGGAQRADGLEAPHVGRDRELRLAKELFHSSVATGRPALLLVDGEAGVGKTRLAWEFEKYIDGLTDPVKWHTGRCLAYGEGVAFWAVAEAVRGRLSADSDDPDQEEGALLEATLDKHGVSGDEREWMTPRLEVLLGLAASTTTPRRTCSPRGRPSSSGSATGPSRSSSSSTTHSTPRTGCSSSWST